MTTTDENDLGKWSPNLGDVLGKIGTLSYLKVKMLDHFECAKKVLDPTLKRLNSKPWEYQSKRLNNFLY